LRKLEAFPTKSFFTNLPTIFYSYSQVKQVKQGFWLCS